MAASPIHRSESGYLRVHGVPCAMACAFCVGGASKRRGRAPAARPRPVPAGLRLPLADLLRSRLARPLAKLETYRQAHRHGAVLQAVDELLEHTPRDIPIRLTADDLLEFPRFFEVVQHFRTWGRTLDLVTPGLRLADAGFASALRDAPVHFTLTYLTNRPAVAAILTGRADAVGLLRQAMVNLKHHDIPFGVNCVITHHNVPELADVVRYLLATFDLPGLSLPAFCLEQVMLDVEPQAFELFASYGEIEAQLLELIDGCEREDKRLSLVDLPPCQFERRLLQSHHLRWEFASHTDSPTASYRSPACADCPLDGRCNHIPEGYRRKHGVVAVDPSELIRSFDPLPPAAGPTRSEG